MSLDELLKAIPHQLAELNAELRALKMEVRNLRDGDRISFNLQEAAKLMGVTYDWLYRACKEGRIRYFQLGTGTAMLIAKEELHRFMDSSNDPDQEDIKSIQDQALRSVRPSKRRSHKLQNRGE